MSERSSTQWCALLEQGLAAERKFLQCQSASREAFLSELVFDFMLYDDKKQTLFGTKALEVCAAISNRATFEYIKDADNYLWYLVMCNMPFFKTKIDWGTSIQGAYWCSISGKYLVSSCGLWDGDRQLEEDLELSLAQWEEFVRGMLLFVKEEPDAI